MVVQAQRVRITSSGWPGGPGITTLYTAPGDPPNLTAIRALWAAMTGIIPSGFTTQVENVGQTIDLTTGKAVGNWTAPAVGAVGGGGAGGYAAPCGLLIRWSTGAFVNGRELRGKTFMVPIPASAYDSDGTISPAILTSVQNAVNTFVTAMGSSLLVYSRKGLQGLPVTSGKVIDKAVVLTSRRA